MSIFNPIKIILFLSLPILLSASDCRDKVIEVGMSVVGITEKSNNDGPIIDDILSTVDLEGTRSPYCAAFNRWCYDNAGLYDIGPRSGWSPTWVKDPTWIKGNGEIPLKADVFGIYFQSKKRVAHTGIVKEWLDSTCITIEGNTNKSSEFGSELDRDGEGIWCKRRIQKQIFSVKNWIGDK